MGRRDEVVEVVEYWYMLRKVRMFISWLFLRAEKIRIK